MMITVDALFNIYDIAQKI